MNAWRDAIGSIIGRQPMVGNLYPSISLCYCAPVGYGPDV
jgi:hypothetical protein